jgi:TolA-binding protein
MAMNGLKKWITIAALAVAPLASAQSTQAMAEGQKSTVDVALAATPVKTHDEQQIDELRREIDALRSAVDARQDREDQRQLLIADPTSHPMWP